MSCTLSRVKNTKYIVVVALMRMSLVLLSKAYTAWSLRREEQMSAVADERDNLGELHSQTKKDT